MINEEIHDLLAYDGIKIIQRKDLFRFSLDSLLLGDFVNINLRANKILDLGTGLAPIPLYLSLKTDKKIIGIEIQEEVYDIAKRSVELNHLEKQIEIINADILDLPNDFKQSDIDIVTVNPPFFKFHSEEFLNDLDSLTISRHEVKIDLKGVIETAKKMLSTGGSLNMIHRANRIEEILVLLNQNRFAVKRMRFVYTKPEKDAMMVLIEARFNANMGDIKIEKPLLIYNESNEYTEEVLKIFHLGDEDYDKKSKLSK